MRKPTMRSLALCICSLALTACSSEGTGQGNAGITGENLAASHQGDQAAGEGAGGGNSSTSSGCTYTQGFWKNHASAWPVASLTIGGISYSEQQLLDLFGTAPMGDASLILGHQLIAALLNIANGAVPSASVQQAINDAQTWMAANLGSNAGLPYGVDAGSAAGQQATALTQTLDDFNSGLSGTPHCGSGGGSGSGSSSSDSGSGSSSASTSSSSASSSTSTSSASSSIIPLPR
jgi:hypothetical protein